MTFIGVYYDYYNKLTAVIEYHVECMNCLTNWTVPIAKINVGNISPVTVTVIGDMQMLCSF